MFVRTLITGIVSVGMVAASSLAASAQDISTDIPSASPKGTVGDAGPERTIGLGLGVAPDYEGSDDYEAVPIPFARFADQEGRFIELFGLKARVNVVTNEILHAGPMVNYRAKRDDDVDDSQVEELDQVDAAVEVGAFFGLQLRGFDASVELTKDAADGHNGILLGFFGGYAKQLNEKWSFRVGASTTYADSDYMDSYFSIDAANSAQSGLDTFDADGDFKDAGVDLTVNWAISDRWGLIGTAAYTRMLGDAEDSPVVDDAGDENQFFGGVVLTYSF